ncbi:hypothetical protein [Microvirga roseola]|uniref:hypothetical protein n=1 Tax=Microvirga roseola TaxID=2883126 RepID=UPI001E5C1D2E|nr:hypothetical protein [Microvirga roseola]
MPDKRDTKHDPAASGSPKAHSPDNAEKWGGGSKGSKGGITPDERRNQQSSAKS